MEDIIDVYEIIAKPIGKGIAIGSKEDIEKYIGIYLDEESAKDYTVCYFFDNELPYFIGDTQVILVNMKDLSHINTNETEVIVFANFEIQLIDKIENLLLN